MATTKQKNLAKLRLEHPTMEKGELVALGGYGPSIIKTPAKVLESQGYKEELANFGLTEELITTALVSDIKSKPKKRFLELSLGAEILGMKKRQPDQNNVLIINVSKEIAEKYALNPSPSVDS